MIAEKDKCKECVGKKVTQETKILEVHVDKGMANGQKLPFRGEGDQMVSICCKLNCFNFYLEAGREPSTE